MHFSSFSISAHKSMKLVQTIHVDVMSRLSEKNGEAARNSTRMAAESDGSQQDQGPEGGQRFNTMPLDLGGNFQWQYTGGNSLDMMGGSLLNWDHSLDFIAGGFGMDTL